MLFKYSFLPLLLAGLSLAGRAQERQVGAIVVATIDGKVVSWTNEWSGFEPSTTTPAAVTTSAEAVVETNTALPTTTLFTSTIVSLSVVAEKSTATTCGQSGDFVLDFDGLPIFAPADNNTADIPPIFNPYEHFFFSGGFGYEPPPTNPFTPHSGVHLAIYTPESSDEITSSPDAGLEEGGEFGAGPRGDDNIWWFNAYGAWLGCDDGGPEDCIMTVYGLVWDETIQNETIKTQGTAILPPCPGFVDCQLTYVDFGHQFVGLSGVRIVANLYNKTQERIWFIDDIELSWWNNTCEAGLLREKSRRI